MQRLWLLVALAVMLTQFDAVAASAGEPNADVKIPTKELVGAINNHDLKWNTNGIIGMMPERTGGATRLVINYCGPEVSTQLLAALDDPERFVAAHVILGRKNLKEIKTDFDRYDQLIAQISRDGNITFDAAQRTALKKLWTDRLTPKNPPASLEPKGKLP